MSFFKRVENASGLSADADVDALREYVPNSVIYVIMYLLALPPNAMLAYLGTHHGLITSRVKYPTLGMTLANLFGLIGFLLLNAIYLFAVLTDTRLSLFTCSFVRTVLYNASYVCYFLFPLLAVDQYLYVCQNYELKIRSLRWIIAGCFAIPMLVAVYDLCLQDDILYDYMFRYIRMSPHTNVFFFFVLAPSFFAFSFVCNLLVLCSILRRQSKTARKQVGRSLNPRQLQHHKSIIYTYIIQAFLPLVLATPYYIAYLCFMFNVPIDLRWFVVGEAIIAAHPLTNALITLFFLRPYRRALRRVWPALGRTAFFRDRSGGAAAVSLNDGGGAANGGGGGCGGGATYYSSAEQLQNGSGCCPGGYGALVTNNNTVVTNVTLVNGGSATSGLAAASSSATIVLCGTSAHDCGGGAGKSGSIGAFGGSVQNVRSATLASMVASSEAAAARCRETESLNGAVAL